MYSAQIREIELEAVLARLVATQGKIWVVTLAIALKKKLSESIAKELILLPIMSIMIDLFGLMHDAMLRRLVRRLFLCFYDRPNGPPTSGLKKKTRPRKHVERIFYHISSRAGTQM